MCVSGTAGVAPDHISRRANQASCDIRARASNRSRDLGRDAEASSPQPVTAPRVGSAVATGASSGGSRRPAHLKSRGHPRRPCLTNSGLQTEKAPRQRAFSTPRRLAQTDDREFRNFTRFGLCGSGRNTPTPGDSRTAQIGWTSSNDRNWVQAGPFRRAHVEAEAHLHCRADDDDSGA